MENVNAEESKDELLSKIQFVTYEGEHQLPGIMSLIEKDLSEPYSVYTYRYFINNWPNLCVMVMLDGQCIGAVVSKLDYHRGIYRGYIAMLAVDKTYRKLGLGTKLIEKTIEKMQEEECQEVVLEVEITNKAALALYTNLGFVKAKRLDKYYMSGLDAFRMKLFLHEDAVLR